MHELHALDNNNRYWFLIKEIEPNNLNYFPFSSTFYYFVKIVMIRWPHKLANEDVKRNPCEDIYEEEKGTGSDTR